MLCNTPEIFCAKTHIHCPDAHPDDSARDRRNVSKASVERYAMQIKIKIYLILIRLALPRKTYMKVHQEGCEVSLKIWNLNSQRFKSKPAITSCSSECAKLDRMHVFLLGITYVTRYVYILITCNACICLTRPMQTEDDSCQFPFHQKGKDFYIIINIFCGYGMKTSVIGNADGVGVDGEILFIS